MIRSYQGKRPVVHATCYVDASAQVIGDVELGENASVWMNAVVRGDVNRIRIGAGSNVQDCAVLHGMRHLYPVLVGEMVTIGHNATVHGRRVGAGSLIGMGATVLGGSDIGRGCLIAAGAVVPPGLVVPDGMAVMGVPGKIVRPVKPDEVKYMQWLAGHYVEQARRYARGDVKAVE